MDYFKISVIIPFYNARKFVTQAVESALSQPETGEVLLIEDASPDGGIDVCTSLARTYPKVKLFQHPDRKNHGAAASRNLGISKSSYPYIAFLDADDYYLPDRFKKTCEILKTDENVDGVYNAMGVFFEFEEDRELFHRTSLRELTTITRQINPDHLFEEIIKIKGDAWYFHINSLTVKKNLLFEVGCFNENLQPHEDTELMYKLAAGGRLVPGDIENPVVIRRVHGGNRITYHLVNKRNHNKTEIETLEALAEWGRKNLKKSRQYLIALRHVDRLRKTDYFSDHKISDYINSRILMFKLALEYPKLFQNYWFWRMVIPSKTLFQKRILV